MPLFFWFDLFLEARAEFLVKISWVFWEIWRHSKDILKLTDLYTTNTNLNMKNLFAIKSKNKPPVSMMVSVGFFRSCRISGWFFMMATSIASLINVFRFFWTFMPVFLIIFLFGIGGSCSRLSNRFLLSTRVYLVRSFWL